MGAFVSAEREARGTESDKTAAMRQREPRRPIKQKKFMEQLFPLHQSNFCHFMMMAKKRQN